ncbi:MAG: Gfo/Idh/MocA family protein [Terrimicrobiaceae bacterium]
MEHNDKGLCPTSPKTIAILGAGGRGAGFAELIKRYAYLGKVTAVAEPREAYREAIALAHDIPRHQAFSDWREFVALPAMADAVVIATMDQDHVGPAVACMELGYDVLLEKPMATTIEDCRAIEAAQRRTGRMVGVCHSLRYQKGFRKVQELIAGGAIGELVTLDQVEQVTYWHQAHSFVRGNWGKEADATFMLMAKSCHDIDYIAYLVGRPCLKVSSFGGLNYFRRDKAPAGSAERCTDGCPLEPACAYSAIKAYVLGNREVWPACVPSADHSYEAHMGAIRTGPYGRCVWKCDNDVVDHQTVSMLFEGDVTATFTMTAFSKDHGRMLRAHGTLGDLRFDERAIAIKTFADNNVNRIDLGEETGGHGGGDAHVIREWLIALHSRDDRHLLANAQESLKTHSIVFAAEKSRREGRMVDVAQATSTL